MRTRDENKEEAIKVKAIEMIVNQGFDGLSMQKLAKAAGVSPATIYIYFQDRDDLIIRLCLEEQEKMANATLKDFDPEMPFDEGLKVQWLNRVNYCLENSVTMHFLEQMKFSPYHEIVYKRMNKTFQQTMEKFVTNAISRGELVELPLEVYWAIAFSPLYVLVKFHMNKKGLPGTENFNLDEKTINQTLKLVLKALKP